MEYVGTSLFNLGPLSERATVESYLPDACGVVRARGDDVATVGAERGASCRTLMLEGWCQRGAGRGVPDARGMVRAPSDDAVTIGTELGAKDVDLMPERWRQ